MKVLSKGRFAKQMSYEVKLLHGGNSSKWSFFKMGGFQNRTGTGRNTALS